MSEESSAESESETLEEIASEEHDDSKSSGGESIKKGITRYEHPLSEEDIEVVIEGLDFDPVEYLEEDLKALEKETGKTRKEILYAPDFKEVGVYVKSIELRDGRLYCHMAPVSSYRIQAIRKGFVKQQHPIAALNGVVITADNKIVLGVRNAQYFNNMLSVVPAGHFKLESGRYNCLEESFYAELGEELGLGKNDLCSVKLIGHEHFTTPEDSVQFTYAARTELTFEEVQQRYEHAPHRDEHSRLQYLDMQDLDRLQELKPHMTPSTLGSLELVKTAMEYCTSCPNYQTIDYRVRV